MTKTMTAVQAPPASRGWGRLLFSEYLVLYLAIAYFVVLCPFTPGLASGENLMNILSNMLPMLVVAIGQTFVLITGGIDLSVTAIIALASVIGASVMSDTHGWLAGQAAAVPCGILAMLGVGWGLGTLNGVSISRLKMPPFMVTLTTMMFFSGFAIWLTKSQNITGLPAAFTVVGKVTPCALVLTAGLAVAAHCCLSRTLLGRWLYAMGHNAKAAAISGVPVARVIWLAYLISGTSAAVASILYTGRLETASPVLGQRILLDIIGATVIGGTSLYGGKGKVIWTVFGVFFIALIDNSLNLLNLSYFTIMIVKGHVILLAALIDALRRKVSEAC
jgi:ribose/xylose/arabinose/galactoside ABC-type transport system permease subunit